MDKEINNICKNCIHYMSPDKGEDSWRGLCQLHNVHEAQLQRGQKSFGIIICGSGYLAVDEYFGCIKFSPRNEV